MVAGEATRCNRSGGDEVRVRRVRQRRVETCSRADAPRRLRAAAPRDHAPLAAGRGRAAAALRIEANSHIAPPKRYLSRLRQLLSTPVLRARPARPGRSAAGRATDVDCSRQAGGRAGSPAPVRAADAHPFALVGWDGCLYPYTFNVADFEPITGRVHQPPPVHQVFEGGNFVICNFVPRKVDYHPLRAGVPTTTPTWTPTSDVLLRRRLRGAQGLASAGSISRTPRHSHGPQPARCERSLGAEYFDELAVGGHVPAAGAGEGGRAVDDGRYAWSWSGRGPS